MRKRTKAQQKAWEDSFENRESGRAKPVRYEIEVRTEQEAWQAYSITLPWGYVGFTGAFTLGLRNEEQIRALDKKGLQYKITQLSRF